MTFELRSFWETAPLEWRGGVGEFIPVKGSKIHLYLSLVEAKGSRIPAAHFRPEIPKVIPPLSP